jgi:hypothetical protein
MNQGESEKPLVVRACSEKWGKRFQVWVKIFEERLGAIPKDRNRRAKRDLTQRFAEKSIDF